MFANESQCMRACNRFATSGVRVPSFYRAANVGQCSLRTKKSPSINDAGTVVTTLCCCSHRRTHMSAITPMYIQDGHAFFIEIWFGYKSQYKRIRNQDETRQNQAPTPARKCIHHKKKYMLKLKNAVADTKTRNQAKPCQTRHQTRHTITKCYVHYVFADTEPAAHSYFYNTKIKSGRSKAGMLF